MILGLVMYQDAEFRTHSVIDLLAVSVYPVGLKEESLGLIDISNSFLSVVFCYKSTKK